MERSIVKLRLQVGINCVDLGVCAWAVGNVGKLIANARTVENRSEDGALELLDILFVQTVKSAILCNDFTPDASRFATIERKEINAFPTCRLLPASILHEKVFLNAPADMFLNLLDALHVALVRVRFFELVVSEALLECLECIDD